MGGRLAGIDALDDLLRALFGTVTIGKAILKCIPALVIEPWVDPNSIAAAVPYRAEQGSPLTTRSRLPVLLGALGGVALALVGALVLKGDDHEQNKTVATVNSDETGRESEIADAALASAKNTDSTAPIVSIPDAAVPDATTPLVDFDAALPPAQIDTVKPTGESAKQAPQNRERRKTGEIALFVKPWANVYLKGKKIGEAPIRSLRLPHGTHRLRLENPVTGAEKTITVKVPSSKPYRFSLN